MKKNTTAQTKTPACHQPEEHDEGLCICFDDFGECPMCGQFELCVCPPEEEFVVDEDELATYLAWQEEICQEGEEAGKVIIPLLKSITREEILSFAGPCPDMPMLVAYQEGNLALQRTQEINRHEVFCRSCGEEVAMFGRADDVDYDPERDYDPHAVPPPPLLELIRSKKEPTYE